MTSKIGMTKMELICFAPSCNNCKHFNKNKETSRRWMTFQGDCDLLTDSKDRLGDEGRNSVVCEYNLCKKHEYRREQHKPEEREAIAVLEV